MISTFLRNYEKTITSKQICETPEKISISNKDDKTPSKDNLFWAKMVDFFDILLKILLRKNNNR